MYSIKLNRTDVPEIINIDTTQRFLDTCYQQIGCNCIEIVHPQRLPAPYALVVDESGLLKDLPVNAFASYLYGADVHGFPIVGTALIVKDVMTDDGPDVDFLDADEIPGLMIFFDDLFLR